MSASVSHCRSDATYRQITVTLVFTNTSTQLKCELKQAAVVLALTSLGRMNIITVEV